MTSNEAAVLGLVQGLTEFLPISSSGHLVIMQHLLGFIEPPLTFDVLVHLGTLVAVIIAFRSDIVNLIKQPLQKTTALIIISCIPTALIGFFFKPFFESAFASLWITGGGLIITGLLLWSAEHFSFSFKRITDMNWWDALLVGMIQGMAITPGISRSGSTIAGGLFLGLEREAAARYSFLLSIPAVLGASLLEAKDALAGAIEGGLSTSQIIPMLLGTLIAAVVGFLAVKAVVKLTKRGKLSIFAYYCWAVGSLVLLYKLLGKVGPGV